MVIDVYAVAADGVWLYEPKSHSLQPQREDDLRKLTGAQDFVAGAPLNLVYVAHGDRLTGVSAQDRQLYASVDAAFIGQNVYLMLPHVAASWPRQRAGRAADDVVQAAFGHAASQPSCSLDGHARQW